MLQSYSVLLRATLVTLDYSGYLGYSGLLRVAPAHFSLLVVALAYSWYNLILTEFLLLL